MKLRFAINVPDWLDRICAWPVMEYRRRKFGYTFRKIRLTEDKFTIVDPQDFYRFNNFQWCAVKNKRLFHAVRLINGSNDITKIVSIHTEIMNPPKGLVVDHRNRDGLDNRRENLRLATHSQNRCNRFVNKAGCSSQYRGVHFHKQRKRWRGCLQYEGKWIWLGEFDNEIEAARAYDRAAIKYHGEFARLNFPREDYANETPSTNG
jgi:hypothetical protein